ncbi:MAG: hypothetical protein WCD04_08575, partial [Terriglobia bacterium]
VNATEVAPVRHRNAKVVDVTPELVFQYHRCERRFWSAARRGGLPLFPLGGTSLLAGVPPYAEMTASKLRGDKAAASCRTPKLRPKQKTYPRLE